MKNKYSLIGIIIGILAIIVAAFQNALRGIFETEPFASDLLNMPMDIISVTFITLALIAIILAIIGFLKKENHRFTLVALATGIMAILWQFVLMAIVIGIILLFISSFGFS